MTASEVTPTTEEVPVRVTDASVRECVMFGNLHLRGEDTNSIGTPLTVEISEKYDDWLADRDRKIAAEAWEEGRINGYYQGYRRDDNPYLADRIEQGGQS